MWLEYRKIQVVSAVGKGDNNGYLEQIRENQQQRIIVNESAVMNYRYIHYAHEKMRSYIGEQQRKDEGIYNRFAFALAYVKPAVYYIHHHINQCENAERYKRCARGNKHKGIFASENQEENPRAGAEQNKLH